MTGITTRDRGLRSEEKASTSFDKGQQQPLAESSKTPLAKYDKGPLAESANHNYKENLRDDYKSESSKKEPFKASTTGNRGRGNVPGPMRKTLRIKEPEPMTPEEARMIRKALGLSIRQMCRLIGFHATSWSAIHHWETGRSKVPKYFCLLLRLLFFCRGTRVGEKLGI